MLRRAMEKYYPCDLCKVGKALELSNGASWKISFWEKHDAPAELMKLACRRYFRQAQIPPAFIRIPEYQS